MSHYPELTQVNIAEFRARLREVLDECGRLGKRFGIGAHGQAEAVLVSRAEWDMLIETLAILTDRDLMKQLADSEGDIRADRVRPAAEVFADLADDDDEPAHS